MEQGTNQVFPLEQHDVSQGDNQKYPVTSGSDLCFKDSKAGLGNGIVTEGGPF